MKNIQISTFATLVIYKLKFDVEESTASAVVLNTLLKKKKKIIRLIFSCVIRTSIFNSKEQFKSTWTFIYEWNISLTPYDHLRDGVMSYGKLFMSGLILFKANLIYIHIYIYIYIYIYMCVCVCVCVCVCLCFDVNLGFVKANTK